MSLQTSAIIGGIADLSVTGVTICGLDDIPEAIAPGDLPVLFPEPLNTISNLVVTRDTMGASLAKWTVTYDLNFTFCHHPIGAGYGLFAEYGAMVDKATAILDALIEADLNADGAVELTVDNVLNFGPVLDPAGNQYHGCQFVLHVTEFIN